MTSSPKPLHWFKKTWREASTQGLLSRLFILERSINFLSIPFLFFVQRKFMYIQAYLKHFNEDLYLHDLFHAPFQKVEESNEINDALDVFYNILESVLNDHAKIVTKRVKTQAKPAWLSPEINEARHKRDYFHKKKNFDSFKFWRNRVTELIRKAKENYYSVAVENNRNTGDIWRCIKQLIPKGSHSIPNLLTDGTNVAETKTDVANLFNKFYTELSSNIFNCETDDPVNTFNALKEFTESKISRTEPFIIKAILQVWIYKVYMLNRI